MTDKELAWRAEDLPLAELQTNVGVMRRQLGLLERIVQRKQNEDRCMVFVKFTRAREDVVSVSKG